MPTDETMTTKRTSFQQQQQLQQQQQSMHQHNYHHSQRRPPDVEEALSSMLWTPYERASTTDTSSDDEDEQLQRRLKKSKSQYDYTSVPTTVPPLTPTAPSQFAMPPTHLTPTNIVAYITTATPVRTATAAVPATSPLTTTATASTVTSSYYTTEDLCDPSVTTPLVPFSNFMLNAHTTTTTTATNDDNDVTIVADINVDDTSYNDVYHNDNRLTATTSSSMATAMMMMSSSYQEKTHISSSSTGTSFSTFGRIPILTKWWSNSSNTSTQPQSITEPNDAVTAAPQPLLPPAANASPFTDEANKQPPSYESLYNKKQNPLRPLRQRQTQHHINYRLNKHLNLLKPVLETLKANVATITQGRFTSLTRSSNNRVTNTYAANAISHTTTTMAATTTTTTSIFSTTTTTTTLTTSVMGENCESTESTRTSNNLVHSFTDIFLHEHCSKMQHVADTNVDNNEHNTITAKNNNNNNSFIKTENSNGETPNQSEEIVIHQQQQKHAHKSTKTIAKQNKENENKQNNNFIICQQQQEQQQQHKKQQLPKTTTTTTANENKVKNEKTKTINEQQQLTTDYRESAFTNIFTTNSMNRVRSGLFYDSSSAISLTRSFEVNTTYAIDCAHANANYFKTDPYETRKSNDTSYTNTTTYSLTPNKCLAELERLYAEFRASESLREQKLRETQNLRLKPTQHRSQASATETENMRLNVPASTNPTSVTQTNAEYVNNGSGAVKTVSETKLNPSTSSVFLTTTNSLTTITNPCQRTPSLTIQVNQNNNNNNNTNNNINNYNYNNNNDDVNHADVTNNVQSNNNNDNEALSQPVILNQAIVNATTTTTTNGVSVINCNYVNNNNNNNNKSITNLCNTTTNSNSQTSSLLSKNNNNNHVNTNNNPYKGNTKASDNVLNNPNSLVPQVLSVKPEDESLQVNVIQVNNETVDKSNNSIDSTPSQSPRRTFTSTECQTDDIASVQLRSPSVNRPPNNSNSAGNTTTYNSNNNREQRRRERRERRHLQHTASLMMAPTHSHPHSHPHPLRHASHLDRHSMPAPPLPPILHPPHLHLQQTGHNVAMLRPIIPDILHNHYPPPYSALPSQLPPPTAGSGNGGGGSLPHHNGSPLPYSHPPPIPQTATATLLGPPPPPPPPGTTLLTSVISTVPIPGATPMVSDGRFTLPLPIIRRSPSERSGKGCCGQWFAGPPLRALIAVVALGGVACALGGAALGATGLAGPPSSHFTAALLMIGVGVVLVTVSGAAWRMTAPGGPPCLGLGTGVDIGRCGRRPCSRGGGAPQGLLYPEFQHRPPPPSYQASMQEYRLRLLLLDRVRQNGVVRGSSPPPTYRSHAGSLLRAPLTTTIRNTNGITNGRCESSIGGSEYSFPPSYRSRNTTPGTISSERSIETEPSGRLLANEDIPEPLSVEQLSEYNSLQQRTLNTSNAHNQHKSEQKRNSLQLDSKDLVKTSEADLNNLISDKKNDLVTIVTITPNNTNNVDTSNNEVNENLNSGNNGNAVNVLNSEARDQIEILAHL